MLKEVLTGRIRWLSEKGRRSSKSGALSNTRGSLMEYEHQTQNPLNENASQDAADLARADDDGFAGIKRPQRRRSDRNKTNDQLSDELASLRLHLRNIEDRNGWLFDQNPAFSLIIDPEGMVQNANKVFLSNLGFTKAELIGKPLAGMMIEEQRKDVSTMVTGSSISGEIPEFEAGIMAKDGSVRTVLFSSSQLLFQEGSRPRCMLLAGVDITARKKAEELLVKLEEDSRVEGQKLEDVLNIDQRISSILEVNQLVDFVIEKSTKLLGAQRCSLMLLDPNSQELLIKGAIGLDDTVIRETRIKVGDSIAGGVARDIKPLLVSDIETDEGLARKNRPSYKSRSFLSVPIELHGKLVGVVNVTDKGELGDGIFNQTDLKILGLVVHQAAIAIENANHCRKLEFLSTTDSLTGIYNHRFFMLALKQEVERCRRYSRPICLLMFDVDNFKSYNDTYGHPEGSQVLKKLSHAVKGALRTVDIFCRYAGDEFAVILPETDIVQAEAIALKIKRVVSTLALRREITLSMGIAAYHKNNDGHGLILKTDQALYQAKREGKDRVCCLP